MRSLVADYAISGGLFASGAAFLAAVVLGGLSWLTWLWLVVAVVCFVAALVTRDGSED